MSVCDVYVCMYEQFRSQFVYLSDFAFVCMTTCVDTDGNIKFRDRCSYHTVNLVHFSQGLLVGADYSCISCHHLLP